MALADDMRSGDVFADVIVDGGVKTLRLPRVSSRRKHDDDAIWVLGAHRRSQRFCRVGA